MRPARCLRCSAAQHAHRLLTLACSQIDAVVDAGAATGCAGLELLGILAQVANAEQVGGGTLNQATLQAVVEPSLRDLRRLLDDPELPGDAADAERHQEAASPAA